MAAALVDRVTDLFKSNLDINASTPEVTSEKHAPVDVVEVVVEPPKQPDIQYLPNEAKWKARTARCLAENPSLPQTALPGGFPKKLESPLVWEGKDWTDASQWEYKLSAEQLKEIDDALKHFKGLNKPLGYLSPSTFPLPTLGPILKDLSRELHTGRGFFVVKTIPVDSYTREENTIIYAGISSYVGPLRGVQDRDGVLRSRPHQGPDADAPAQEHRLPGVDDGQAGVPYGRGGYHLAVCAGDGGGGGCFEDWE
ncbi:hypothetical protein NLJ89_g9628 [Agrocybe chaxingu]|uniref:Uncharacterized protein n=1 Tax=Agrocybe chaxingu TaxID=84603 RepID=A0A9W8JZM6_9AGAR|nr:hypothetical protein NLJ89_g9628 [Agrocybe chaxingu]